MDPLGAIALSAVVIISLSDKGYKDESQKVKLTLQAGIVAGCSIINSLWRSYIFRII